MKLRFAIVSILTILLFTACTKDSTPLQDPSSFAATIDGTDRAFVDFISVISEPNPMDGTVYLNIVAERGISSDSSNQIKFAVPDFTANGTSGDMTYQLNTLFPGNFIEWKNRPNGVPTSKNHYFQTGQLKITQLSKNLISGEFNFTYHLFDANGQKTGEHHITNGRFTNLTITRY